MFYSLSENLAYQEAIALAGLFQAAAIVEEIAKKGTFPEDNFVTSIGSIFKLNPDSVEEIYGGQVNYIPGLSLGFSQLIQVFDKKQSLQSDVLRYVLGLINLQGKLAKDKDMLSVLRSRLEQLSENRNHFDITHDRMLAGLASTYQDTLSNFRFRIQVNGNQLHLQNPLNVDKIRAVLLAGIRAALLWRQVGGKRWHLIFNAKQIRNVADTLA
jgi:high frequency lysogenization protein